MENTTNTTFSIKDLITDMSDERCGNVLKTKLYPNSYVFQDLMDDRAFVDYIGEDIVFSSLQIDSLHIDLKNNYLRNNVLISHLHFNYDEKNKNKIRGIFRELNVKILIEKYQLYDFTSFRDSRIVELSNETNEAYFKNHHFCFLHYELKGKVQ